MVLVTYVYYNFLLILNKQKKRFTYKLQNLMNMGKIIMILDFKKKPINSLKTFL